MIGRSSRELIYYERLLAPRRPAIARYGLIRFEGTSVLTVTEHAAGWPVIFQLQRGEDGTYSGHQSFKVISPPSPFLPKLARWIVGAPGLVWFLERETGESEGLFAATYAATIDAEDDHRCTVTVRHKTQGDYSTFSAWRCA